VLNFIAYAHLIPVVDGGIQAGVTRQGKLRYADWRAHVAMPGRRCLACIGQYDASLVQAEREGYLDDPAYIKGLPYDHQIKRNENVFAFSLGAASLQLLQMLMMIISPLGVANPGEQKYHFVPGLFDKPRFDPCDGVCPYPSLTSQGDLTSLVVTGPHRRAEEMRKLKGAAVRPNNWRLRLGKALYRLAERLTDS
jgi:molybdopterin-synthase adenylyltransferase